jgi:hypothetical protein
MQPNAVQASMIDNIPIHVRSTFSEKTGTKIIPESEIDYKKVVTGIAYSKGNAKVSVVGVVDKPGVAADIFEPIGKNNINIDMVIQNTSLDGKKANITFTIKREDLMKTLSLIEQNKQIVISADKSPSDLDGVQDRLKSRLGCGLVADIHPTTYELRLGILIEKAQKRGVEIPAKVLEFISHRIISNVREMEGALNRLVAHATLVGTAITVETAQVVLQDLLKSSNKKITIEEIQKKVAEHFNIRITDMHSPRRSRSVARPRQIAMYLAKSV